MKLLVYEVRSADATWSTVLSTYEDDVWLGANLNAIRMLNEALKSSKHGEVYRNVKIYNCVEQVNPGEVVMK